MSAEGQIRSYFERWQRLEEAKAAVAEDLKELFAEAKSLGHDTKAMRVAFRGKVKDDARTPEDEAFDAVVETYRAAIDDPFDDDDDIVEKARGILAPEPRAHPAPAREKTLKKSVQSATADHTSSSPHEADASGETNSNPQAPGVLPASEATADKAEAAPPPAVSAAYSEPDAPKARPEPAVNPAGHVDTPAPESASASTDGGAFAAAVGPDLADANGVEPPPSAFTNPRCLKPDTCHLVHSKSNCHECSLAWAERPKAEQVMLWQRACAEEQGMPA